MENASKALIMAGGVLLALMIVGALVLMFNQISTYQRSSSTAQKQTQMSLFNQDFAKYADEKSLDGTDIISLINKVVDYNQKNGITNQVDYDRKIKLTINNIQGFITKYGTNKQSKIFGKQQILVIEYNGSTTVSTSNFIQTINEFTALEKKYTLASMGKLKSNYTNLQNGETTIQEVTGKNINITMDNLAKYIEYTEFKSSKFEPVGVPRYDGDQISELTFRFVN